eukprot:1385843-Prymnesium_polylepis.1
MLLLPQYGFSVVDRRGQGAQVVPRHRLVEESCSPRRRKELLTSRRLVSAGAAGQISKKEEYIEE